MEKLEKAENEFTKMIREIRERRLPGSKTAMGVAVHRADESTRPEGERICYDPYAVYFISSEMRHSLAHNPDKVKEAMDKYNRYLPGLSNSIRAKVRFFDDFVKKSIDEGLEQLVVLGAGYDSRPYRIAGLNKIRVFEVDHPDTQTVKMEKIKEIFGSLPNHVVYIPADLVSDDFGRRLLEGGYDRSRKTLFIMEGVIFYIPPKSVDNILDFIVKNSGKGSTILFDYFPQSVIDGTSDSEAGRNIHDHLAQVGEPLQFGLKEGTAEEFLGKRGFSKVCNVTGEDYKKAYFHGVNKDKAVCTLMSFVHAVVE